MDSLRIRLESFIYRAYSMRVDILRNWSDRGPEHIQTMQFAHEQGNAIRLQRIQTLARGWLIERARSKKLRAEVVRLRDVLEKVADLDMRPDWIDPREMLAIVEGGLHE